MRSCMHLRTPACMHNRIETLHTQTVDLPLIRDGLKHTCTCVPVLARMHVQKRTRKHA